MTGIRWILSTGCGGANSPLFRCFPGQLTHRVHRVIGESTNNLDALVALSLIISRQSTVAFVVTSRAKKGNVRASSFSALGKKKGKGKKLWQRKRTQGTVAVVKNKPSRSPHPAR
jgi:hypothetical protein